MIDKHKFFRSLFCLLLMMNLLSSCTDTIDRLKRVGKAPDLASVEIPKTQGDAEDPEEAAIRTEARKKRTNSLWQPGSTSFFRDSRSWQVGDIVRVKVGISDSAQLNNSTNQSRTGNDGLTVSSLFGKQRALSQVLSSNPTNSNNPNLINANNSRSHVGTGGINRKEAINTVIAAVVSQILSNGNLVINGKQEIRVNHELREVKVSGIIRPRDIASDNSVTSDQIAEARISYGGRGVMSDVQDPRVGSQIVDILSPF